MDSVEKIFTGTVVFVITSVIAYLFRVRQLYVVAPALYKHAPVSQNGSLCEIVILNRGLQVEDSIQVGLDPSLKCELLASSSAAVILEDSIIKIDRLHKFAKESAILLVEAGILDSSKITSVSSRKTKGRIIKKLADVPPNYGWSAIFVAFLVGFIPMLELGRQGYLQITHLIVESNLKTLINEGWRNLDTYYASDLKLSYSDDEFPIRYIKRKINEHKRLEVTYEIYNKTARTLEVYADRKRIGATKRDPLSPYRSTVEVAPMSKGTFVVNAAPALPGLSYSEIEFSMSWGAEYLYGITNVVEWTDPLSQ